MVFSKKSRAKKAAPGRRPGRPATGKDPLISLRIPEEIREEVTAWGIQRGMNRSKAIRALIEIGLDGGGRFS
jgi:hypothetical protein